MKFSIGDKVRTTGLPFSTEFKECIGVEGMIDDCDPNNQVWGEIYRVIFTEPIPYEDRSGKHNMFWYEEKFLESAEQFMMLAPDFSLEDIHQAQALLQLC